MSCVFFLLIYCLLDWIVKCALNQHRDINSERRIMGTDDIAKICLMNYFQLYKKALIKYCSRIKTIEYDMFKKVIFTW